MWVWFFMFLSLNLLIFLTLHWSLVMCTFLIMEKKCLQTQPSLRKLSLSDLDVMIPEDIFVDGSLIQTFTVLVFPVLGSFLDALCCIGGRYVMVVWFTLLIDCHGHGYGLGEWIINLQLVLCSARHVESGGTYFCSVPTLWKKYRHPLVLPRIYWSSTFIFSLLTFEVVDQRKRKGKATMKGSSCDEKEGS